MPYDTNLLAVDRIKQQNIHVHFNIRSSKGGSIPTKPLRHTNTRRNLNTLTQTITLNPTLIRITASLRHHPHPCTATHYNTQYTNLAQSTTRCNLNTLTHTIALVLTRFRIAAPPRHHPPPCMATRCNTAYTNLAQSTTRLNLNTFTHTIALMLTRFRIAISPHRHSPTPTVSRSTLPFDPSI